MQRRQAPLTAAVALVVMLVSGCITVSPVPGGSPTESTAVGATPPAAGDPGDLTPPVPEEVGDIPADEETVPALGHLTLGSPTDLVSQTIGAGGGILEASGLSISIPDGALSGDTAFHVQQATITGADFGGLVTPITPLYLVNDGEAALSALVTLTMSAAIPAGALAMGFSYDDTAGTITPLIPISQDGSSLTVGATHFSSLFGALVDSTVLPTTADSGFRPGKDDWEFTNFGSYVAPGGHCNGQSSTAIWYYVNQYRKAAAHRLYGVYDNNGQGTKTPDFWPDDSYGYRFASAVQVDPVANPFSSQYFRNFLHEPNDRATYETFRAAISTSAEPQLVWIGNDARHVAHAMVVYRVEKDQLFVADPNYPARLRTIPYDPATGKLGPYSSGENAAEILANGGKLYTRFTYLPWRSRTSEEGIAAHWEEFKAGAAGDAVFPPYELDALTADNSLDTLVDGYRTAEKTLTVQLMMSSYRTMQIYRGTSATPLGPWGSSQRIELQDGENALGVLVYGRTGDVWAYLNFVRLKVNLVAAASPSLTAGPSGPVGVAVRMDIAGSFVRDTHLADLKVQATGPRTFGKQPSETRIKDLAGEIAADGKSVTLTITYLDDPTGPSLASCPNVTILRNIPLRSTDPTTRTQTFFVSGWDAIIATIQDSYPYFGPTLPRAALCMTTAGWSFNQDANPNPTVYVTLGY